MTTLKIENFTGIAPRWSNRLLANSAAVTAANAKLLSGELRGLRETQSLYNFGNVSPEIARAYRLPATVGSPLPISGSDFWLGFTDPQVDFVRTPVLEDSFERYYWTSDSTRLGGVPQYNTRARIQGGSGSFVLGIPAPTTAPTVTPPAGTDVERAYVYTFVSAYGEEGAPSPPTTATGTSGSWAISGIQTTVTNQSNYNLATTRIYRTVPGATSTEYYWVADIAFGTATYTDTATDASVALNYTMQSLTWDPPPQTLKGLVAHPGGFLIGFTGRDLYMSVPYQPHAWPVQNIQTCQTEIVGVSIYNNVIIVATTSHPYWADGMSPDAVTLEKIESIDPCVSRRGMATTIDGVYYPSPQGIVLATGGQTQLVTRWLFTREEWQLYFSPTTVNAVPYGVQYIAFDSTATGFIFTPQDYDTAPETSPYAQFMSTMSLTTLDRFTDVQTVQIDQYSGDVYIVQGNQVRLWDPPTSTPYTYTWTSKEFDLPKPVNFGAMRVKFQGSAIKIPVQYLADYTTYNTNRYALGAASQTPPVLGAPSTSTTGGTLAANTYYYVIEAILPNGVSVRSNEVSIATTGTTSSNTLNWTAYTNATGYKIFRGTSAKGENYYYTVGAVTTFVDTGAVATAGTPMGNLGQLAPINSRPINGARKLTVTSSPLDPQNRAAINGSTLYPVGALENPTGGVQVNIYARDENQDWNLVYNWSVKDEKIKRLPSGFKSDGWQIQLIGNVPVYSVVLAETGEELAKV